MNLIAKNKIAKYIYENPAARVDLVVWLEEAPYLDRKMDPSEKSRLPQSGCSFGTIWPGGGDFVIKYITNNDVETSCITWIGTKEELDQEHKKMLENPGHSAKSLTIQVTVPAPDLKDILQSNKHDAQETQTIVINNHQTGTHHNPTKEEYETILTRATAIFEAKSNTTELEELRTLIPSILRYEEYQLKFPSVYAYEIVASRMNLFQLTPYDLANMTGISPDNMSLFLAGKLTLGSEILIKLYKKLGLHLPISN